MAELPTLSSPTRDAIFAAYEAQASSGWQRLQHCPKRGWHQSGGLHLDLSGIAKGFAANEFERILRDNGISDALLDLGGSVTVLGAPDEAGAWTVGIQDPLAPTGVAAAQVRVVHDVVVQQRGRLEELHRRAGAHRGVVVRAAESAISPVAERRSQAFASL